jgi:hypothetical protein
LSRKGKKKTLMKLEKQNCSNRRRRGVGSCCITKDGDRDSVGYEKERSNEEERSTPKGRE